MDAIIPRLERFAIEGMFGEINLLRVGQSPDEEKSRTSQVYFFEVDLVTRKGKVRKVPVAVKLLPDTPLNISHYANFGKEVTVYREVLPSLRAQEIDLHPTVYYAESTVGKYLGELDILILEDVRRKGFNVPKNVFLDANHINLAVKKLGEFHGLAYRLKLESPEKFGNVKDLLPKMYQKSSDMYVKAAIHRALEEELENSPGYSVLSRAFKKMCDKNIYDLMYQYLCAPEEPYAVVVHGQFMMGNVLFQYDEEERPCGIKVVDFSLAEYADPTVDLSVFLCMHASEEREENWNDHLKSYWEGVLSVGNPGFTYEEFAKNFAKKAIYGFIRSVFLLPLTFDEVRGNDIFTDEFKATSDQTKRERSYTIGGDDATKAVRSLARFFHSEGYLEEYLLNFKQ